MHAAIQLRLIVFLAVGCAIVSVATFLWLLDHPDSVPAAALVETSHRLTGLPEHDPGEVSNEFLGRYCLECHSGDQPAADLSLQLLIDDPSTRNVDLWSQVFEAIDLEYMPPAEHHALPTDDEIRKLKNVWLDHQSTERSSGHQTSIRRLTRDEFENTIRDLFQLHPDPFVSSRHLVIGDKYFQPSTGRMPDYVMAFSHFEWLNRNPSAFNGVPSLPVDPPVEHGFDNNIASVSTSPLHLERILEFASGILHHPEFRRTSAIWNDLFVCNKIARADVVAFAEQRLAEFLPIAFRGAVSDDELNRFMTLFAGQLDERQSYEAAMKSTLHAVLASPRFLFRFDLTNDSSEYNDWQVASRLSYLLWGSMPDDELRVAAEQGRLNTEKEIRKQIQRLLNDPRSRWLSTSFGLQWLKTMKAIDARPDRHLFWDYYRRHSQSPPGVSMAIEQMLLFETVFVENRSILDFIDTDFGYANRLLLEWYGLDVESAIGFLPDEEDTEDFFRIQWPDRTRGGILTCGATLLSTSTTNRTSPVFRGDWILDVIYNRPPPAPPADVPSLVVSHDDLKTANNIRERLAIHRQNPRCAVCHDRMDPPGFTLEEYDAVGMFRSTYRDGSPVDARGELAGRSVNGVLDLKDAILDERQEFVRGFVEHFLEYSLGRALATDDEQTIDEIVRIAKEKNCRFRDIIEEVALHAALPAHRHIQPPRRLVAKESDRR